MTVRILVGNCLDVLRGLPTESVQCVTTSPPYFGLRSYGTNPTVWGGSADCDHDWQPVGKKGYGTGQGFTNADPGYKRPLGLEAKAGNVLTSGQCNRCGAWLGELGLEPTPDLYVAHLVEVFREIRRVLRRDGTVWLNLGDSFAGAGPRPQSGGKGNERGQQKTHKTPDRDIGLKPKDLIGIPWRVAFALQADGWWLRSDIIWAKPNPMPESVTDRPTKAHEYLFLLTKRASYFYDADAVREQGSSNSHGGGSQDGYQKKGDTGNGHSGLWVAQPAGEAGRNLRSVWTIATQPLSMAHFATFPPALVEPCLRAGTSERGCCPHCGTGWRRVVERRRFDRTTDRLYGGTLGNNPSGKVPNSNTRGCPDPEIRTVGWQPACTCPPHEPVPCVVLDPFSGAGTVSLVASRLGRDAIGIELNPEYAAMSRQRLEEECPMFAAVEVVA